MSSSVESEAVPGRLIVISGPSGTGKTTICNQLLERLPRAIWSVSVTTRPKRGAEVEGKDYTFVSHDKFEVMRKRGEFLEWACYVGHEYGTRAEPVRRAVSAGQSVVLEIDVQGAIQVAEKMPESLRLFILPPTQAALEARLRGRKTETDRQIDERLAKANAETIKARESGAYDHFVTNDDLDETVDRVLKIVQKGSQVA